ncbi:MAG: T9SS type A sorting domain-containing protein [Candidatus Latescibacteria bacterium]|nr:T9SS type A sorting domain-containing protein [Candidatus Latescibacterota bacterium]
MERILLKVVMIMTLTVIINVNTVAMSADFGLERINMITNEASGNQGNSWGGHQCRIVRTEDGVFAVYMFGGENDAPKVWRLAWLDGDNWKVIADDSGGNSPVHLLASPDGVINVIGWPETGTVMWSGKPKNGAITLKKQTIGGLPKNSVIYYAAGISENGDICVTNSGGNESQGQFRWSFYEKDTDKWTYHYTRLDYRYCYSYVFPLPDGKLSIVSNRDEPWSRLGYEAPDGGFGYVFNAIRHWHTNDIYNEELTEYGYLVEEPSDEQLSVQCYMGYHNAYLDTDGRMHIIYRRYGPSTESKNSMQHAIFSEEGNMLYNELLPDGAEGYCDIFQDDRGQFFLLSSTGLLFPAGDNGISYGEPLELDFQGHQVEYSGFWLATPRSGTPRDSIIDGAFSTNGGTSVIYFRLTLYNFVQTSTTDSTEESVPKACSFALNTPNPFNISTTLSYMVSKDTEVILEVYDILGRKVRHLADGKHTKGTYSAIWNGKDYTGRDVTSGLYFARLTAEGYHDTIKLVLIK